jgi:hypothetical protein
VRDGEKVLPEMWGNTPNYCGSALALREVRAATSWATMTSHGRRKTIPWRVKCEAALARQGLTIREVEWHHTPPLALREWCPKAQDTIPPANDPNHIVVLLIAEHRLQTTGRRGESRLSISGDGDVSRIRKAERLREKEFRRRVLSPGTTAEPTGQRPKRKIPSRPFRRTK